MATPCRYLMIALLTCLSVFAAGQAAQKKHLRRPTSVRHSLASIEPFTSPTNGAIKVDILPSHVLNSFSPAAAMGAGVDEIGAGSYPTLFSPSNISAMTSAGFGSLSYRLYTELNVEDWHWNPSGTWSDSRNSQGYFVGNSTLGSPILHSTCYRLTHRGSTFDQGDNSTYSVLDDGDPTTYWKSNPYLTSTYTHEADSLHPQWMLFVLPTPQTINAVKIQWANPYAVNYSVQYWNGDDPLFGAANGTWVAFPGGTVTNGKGGTALVRFAQAGVYTQFVRVLMTVSSNTYDTHGTSDPRNRMGYAVSEVGIGSVDSQGQFTDFVSHSRDQNQTPVYVSSTDPWHSNSSLNADSEQIGLDAILSGNLAKGLPALVPVPMIYSTPQNALAEISYLMKRKYPLLGVELGEEADGQYMTPEDYAALYIQWASAIHAHFPTLKLGGPVTSSEGAEAWPDSRGVTDYLQRFVNYLTAHHAIASLGFVSTEHYPFYQAAVDWSLVPQEVEQIQSMFTWLSKAKLAKTVPLYITEVNLSAAPAEPIVDLVGALWQAVFVGEFMKHGGAASYYYQYLPYQISNGGTNFGLIGMFASDANDQVISKTSQFFSSQMINQEWCLPGKLTHRMNPTTTTITDVNGTPVVLSYALTRPDGLSSLLIVNTDAAPHTITVSFNDTKAHYFAGNVSQAQFSSANYSWVANGLDGIATPDGPYQKSTVASSGTTKYTLPAHSLTVLRGKIL